MRFQSIGVEFGPCGKGHLQQVLLYFDRLAVINLPGLKYTLTKCGNSDDTSLWKNYEWLQDQGLVFDLGIPRYQSVPLEGPLARDLALLTTIAILFEPKGPTRQQVLDEIGGSAEMWQYMFNVFRSLNPEDYITLLYTYNLLIARLWAAQIASQQGDEVSVTLPFNLNKNVERLLDYAQPDNEVTSHNSVLEVVVRNLPTPTEDVTWEEILQFRGDLDSKRKLTALREWVNDVARARLTAREVEQKLAYLLDEYDAHMRLHRIKTKSGLLRTICVTSAEVMENILKLKLGDLAKMPFELHEKHVALLEAERSAPGRQLAYLLQAREIFTPPERCG